MAWCDNRWVGCHTAFHPPRAALPLAAEISVQRNRELTLQVRDAQVAGRAALRGQTAEKTMI